MFRVEQIKPEQTYCCTGLAELLIDGVKSGASVGFLHQLPPAKAILYWENVFQTLDHSRGLWIARTKEEIIGTVQLLHCTKDNGLHRAEVQKLLVHSSYRGRGVASMLMSALENYAKLHGISLMVLDTESGSAAEDIYRHLGWIKAGEIPLYARNPACELQATAYYYKALS